LNSLVGAELVSAPLSPPTYVIPAKAGIHPPVIAFEESAAIPISLTDNRNFLSKKEGFLKPFVEYKNIIVYINIIIAIQ